MPTWREREALNEARFRDQNEWIEATSESYGGERMMVFVCECGDAACLSTVMLTRPEYESVRSVSNRFVIARDHENPETEVLISEGARFSVVDKIGEALRVARDTDPRQPGGRPKSPA